MAGTDMDMDMDDFALQRKAEQLYGPGRTAAREAAKRLLEEDHVFVNFQKGSEPGDPQRHFCSETTASFRGRRPPPSPAHLDVGSKWNPSSQNATHLSFGSDAEPQRSVVQTDYTAKPVPQYRQIVPEGLHEVHLADMAPKYIANKAFGWSLYQSDFDGRQSYGEWSSRMAKEGKKVGRRHKTTGYQKATHFELGSDPHSLKSETSQCFTDRASHSGSKSSGVNPVSVDRSRSNVFRQGDYNAPSTTPTDHFLSVQKVDFGPESRRAPPPAGVSSATRKGYSHVFPRHSSRGALTALRQFLVEKNSQAFQNPRDPTTINVLRAFLTYDRDRSGDISVEELRAACDGLGTPITEAELSEVLKECDSNGDGKIDYVEFTKYLTANMEPQSTGMEFQSTLSETYTGNSNGEQVSAQTSEDAFMGVHYQTSTHFQFGNEGGASSSIYVTDYGPDRVRGLTKSPHALAPPSSKVMHEFPVVAPDTTTSRRSYIKHDMAAREADRLTSLQQNQGRHEQLAVELTSGQDRHSKLYKSSVMSSSYVAPPPGTCPAPPVDPIPKQFHHLESNRALPRPPSGPGRSEVQAMYGVPVKSSAEGMQRKRAALTERTSRITDNKSTHFILGFDQPLALSEKMAEFGNEDPMDSRKPAAGKASGPIKGYSVISHDSGGDEGSDEGGRGEGRDLQQLLQQRNFLRNMNPRDPLNINLRKAFLEYDKDLSGSISREEIVAVCKAMGVSLSDEDLQQLVSRCDKDGDGQVDYHEFTLHLSRHNPPGPAPTVTNDITTTTRRDFGHPSDQTMSAMQRLVVDQDKKRWVPLQPTHFFHLDTSEDYLKSTTRKDFTSPTAAC